jgi:hypothetical protein
VIANRAFGGTLATQLGAISIAIQTTVSTAKGYLAIRNLHIDQHRSWMFRTWAYASAVNLPPPPQLNFETANRVQILSMRIILVLVALAAKLSPSSYRTVSTCQEIIFMYEQYSLPMENVYSTYPMCRNFTSSVPAYVVVNADFTIKHPEQLAAIFSLSSGPSVWAAQIIHIFAVEIYLRMMKDEDERLKSVSLARRKAAGMVDIPSKTGQM